MKSLKAIWMAAALIIAACGTDEIKKVVADLEEEAAKSDIGTCPNKGAETCPAATVANGENCDASGDGLVTVSGTAQDFQSDRALSGAIVSVLNNDTGEPTGVCGKTDSAGKLAVKVPKGKKVAFSTSKLEDQAKDTYQFNITYTTDSDETFFSVSNITAQLIPGIIGEPLDPTKATVAGTVYNMFGKAITTATTPSGAPISYKVRTKSGQKAYYFDDGIPNSDETELNTKSGDSLFVAFGLVPGKQELELTYNGVVTAVTDNTLFAFPDSIAISNITCTKCP